MNENTIGNLNRVGRTDAPILIVTDAPSAGIYDRGDVMSAAQMKLMRKFADESGIPGAEFQFLTPCPAIPEGVDASERKLAAFIDGYREEFQEVVTGLQSLQLVIACGKVAARQVMGKAVKITLLRGSFTESPWLPGVPVLPVFSPANVLRRPEVKPVFEGDLLQVAALRDAGWNTGEFAKATDGAAYRWCLDLQPLIDNPPVIAFADSETLGLSWADGRKAILTAQITLAPGEALVVPLDIAYFNEPALRGETSRHLPLLTQAMVTKLIRQLTQIFGNPATRFAGHNFKYDVHHFLNYGIKVANWFADSMQLAWACDENMDRRNQDECVRRWVPEMAGYADAFNSDPIHQSKSRMDLVPHDKMIKYAGGDTDSGFRLMARLAAECKRDSRQWNVFQRVQMPALKLFVEMERAGMQVDTDALRALGVDYAAQTEAAYKELMAMAAKKCPAVLRKHEEAGLRFSRDAFVIDLLFCEEGFNLTPREWTATTRKGPKEERVPSVSSTTHLPFFEHVPFVSKLMAYQKMQKMRTTYVGVPAEELLTPIARLKNGHLPKAVEAKLTDAGVPFSAVVSMPVRRRIEPAPSVPVKPRPAGPVAWAGNIGVDSRSRGWKRSVQEATGFWQHLCDGDMIYPSFHLSRTVTGRTSSSDPNFQNIPKRGPLAPAFRRIFVAGHGWVFIEADLSQAELRIAAVMANERNMLRIYREGGDIHTATAAGVLGMALEDVGKEDRQKAKAINFGFLYGMWWKKFMDYAKTQYGVTFTARQAEATRERFFALYPGLEGWHKEMIEFVKANGFVRSLHGALRRLPSINSDDEGIRGEVGRQAINSPVQRFASDLGLMAVSRFKRDCPDRMKAVSFIHDAGILRVREEDAIEAASALKYYMENNPLQDYFGLNLPIPIISDVSIGARLDEMKEQKNFVAVRPVWYDES